MNKNWCFTLNNYDDDDIINLNDSLERGVTYMIYGKETGESGTPHLQGYLELEKVTRLEAVKKLLKCPSIHLEGRKGTQEQAIQYCMKENNFEELGEKRISGRPKGDKINNKALQCIQELKNGRSMAEIACDPTTSFNMLKHLMTVAPLIEKGRDPEHPPEIYWYWGKTGTGKTRRAYWEAQHLQQCQEPYVKSSAGIWFDGYDGQKVAIFDDLRSNWFEYSFLLKLLDRYPHRVQIKGGSRQWKPDVIYITSPFPPKEMYTTMQENDNRDLIDQLLRRITTVTEIIKNEYSEGWVPPDDDKIWTAETQPYP